jgi:peptidoglycan-N-acetylglucosamine deacetylase
MNILSFDIEEWFHILDNESTKTEADWAKYECRIHQNMDKIFRLLDDTKQSATFFCIGWVARKYPEIIKRIDELDYEIASHSDLHQLVYEQSKEVFTKDLKTSIDALEGITGKKVRAYRAPGFSIGKENQWAFEALIEHGIEIDCSIFPAARAHGGFADFGVAEPCLIEINGLRLKEFPINLYPFVGKKLIFSGGGYFRLLPEMVLNNFWKKSDYVMTYFHPRDFDHEQPMIEGLSVARKFKSYYGLKGSLPKLHKISQKHPFIDLRTADKIVDWSLAKVKVL